MTKGAALLVAAMVLTIVGADVLLFRDSFRARLAFNVAVVALSSAIYFLFIRRG